MRAGESMGGDQHERDRERHGDSCRRERPAEGAGEQAERQRDRARGERDDAGPARKPPGDEVKDLRQPFLGDPRLAAEGEGERVGVGESVDQDPVADGDVPVGVAVVEERRAAGQKHGKGDEEGRVRQRGIQFAPPARG